jgi:lysyl-tRNA synthetase class 2
VSQYESQFEENLYQLRRDKLAQIAAIARTLNPALTDAEARYPNTFPFTTTVPKLRAIGENGDLDPLSTEDLADMHIEAAIAGRIMAIRVQGKAGFAQLQQHGERLQLYVRKDDVGEALFNLYKLLDLGDHIGVRGFVMRTRTGELTLHAAPITLPGHEGQPALTLLTKAMLALPDKYHGLEDVELRYRQRYVDLIVNSGHTAKPTPSAAVPPAVAIPPSSVAIPPPSAAIPPPSAAIPPPSAVIPPPSAVIQSEAKDLSISPEAPQLPAETTDTTDTPPNVREVFVKRAHILRSIRHFFDTRGYLEVETPMLHTISGGAAARPFETHHNALSIDLKLRIAPELYLKRLVVGGLDRVYEINRNFRNEGVSTQHNPEFTMLEFYQAYANYKDLMQLTQDLITTVAQEVNGTTLTTFDDVEIDLSKWTKLSMREAIIKFWPTNTENKPTVNDLSTEDAFRAWSTNCNFGNVPTSGSDDDVKSALQLQAAKLRALFLAMPHTVVHSGGRPGPALSESDPAGKQIATLFEILAEPRLIQPTIIYDFPLAVSPLSKVKPDEPDWVERFEFYIGGFEVGNAFSELNDPDDQRARFEAQLAEKARGDDEAMPMDEDYVRALGYGLPPTAGEGIGIDRLTMILTGSRSIRDVILFPLMRPQKPTPETEAEAANQPHGESAE